MACSEEHWFGLDYAMRHCSWLPPDRFGYQGWQAGRVDLFNRLTVLPDRVGDWLWQKFPFAPAVLRIGLQRVRRDVDAGAPRAAALKLALLSHYLADIVAVSHTWLDFFGDEIDFEYGGGRDAFSHFYNSVEERVAPLLAQWQVPPPAANSPRRFAAYHEPCLSRAYELGKAVFDAYFASLARAPLKDASGEPPPLESLNELQRQGVENACVAVWALWEWGVRDGGEGLPGDERQAQHWTLKPLLEWSADEIEARALQPETVAAFQQAQGWTKSDIFRALQRCSPAAQAEGALWQAQRDEWRTGTMAGILPPRPQRLVTVDWRPGGI
jgi:hypothetical protein